MKSTTESLADFSPNDLQPDSSPDAPQDVFISIQPHHANNILNGSKTVEFRRRFPIAERVIGAMVWIYSTSPVKAVIGVARVEAVDHLPLKDLWSTHRNSGGIDRSTFSDYFSGITKGCAIRLVDVTALGDNVPAASLKEVGFHVPQSYRYVTDDVYPLLKDAFGETATRHQCRDRA